MNRKSIYMKLLTALLATTLFYGCSNNAVSENNADSDAEKATINYTSIGDKDISTVINELVTYDKEDTYSDWKNENPNYIELNGSTAALKGTGAEVKDGKITITTAGVYVVSGKLDRGQILVDVEDKGTVKIVLNGAEINCDDNAPIYVMNAEKTIISLVEGTENKVSDGEKYVIADSSSDEPSAAIFSKDNLIINGKGKLIVNGNYNDGITSKDDLKITGGNIEINSKDDGLIGKDMVAIKEGTFKIQAEGDAIKASNDTDATKGFIAIESGTFNILAEKDGLQGESYVLIADGAFHIQVGGGNTNGIKKANEEMKGQGGAGMNRPQRPDMNNNGNTKPNMGSNIQPNMENNTNSNPAPDASTSPIKETNKSTTENMNTTTNSSSKSSENSNATDTETETESTKAIKAAGEVAIKGGTFILDSADDAIHTNNSVIIAGGEFTIASGDDGIHADTSIITKGGKINITKSYEGIESSLITISGGEIHVTASDDGINVAGGADGSAVNGRPGQNNFSSSGNNKLNINGGYIVVNSTGDGLDSNGSIYMTDGTVVVSGPTSDGNGALDYDGTFEITGGYLISAGSSGMAQATSEESTQNTILMTYPEVQQAGIIAHLQDDKGNTIATFAPTKNYTAVVISSPQLKKDSSYTLYSGGKSIGTVTDGVYKDGNYEGGTKVVDFTITTSVTWLNESGVTTGRSGMHGGQGGQGKPGTPSNPGVPGNQTQTQNKTN